jgi:phospholipase/carboxylesterase
MLGFNVSGTGNAGDSPTVLVLLHGRGSHRGDLQALRPSVPEEWVLVTPQAPHAGHPWGYGPGWAWYRYVAEDRVVDETLRQSLAALEAFLTSLPALLRLEPGRVVLGGFSQGGTTSLAYALTHPGTVAAVLNFSGFLADAPVVETPGPSPETTRVFWGHGKRDPNIPWDLARKGRERLVDAGVPLTARDYDIGHWIVPEEVAEAVRFVEDLEHPSSPPGP